MSVNQERAHSETAGGSSLRTGCTQESMEHPGNAAAYSFDRIEPLENSPLKGKTVCFLGSSVTVGAASLHQSLPEYFAARTGCCVIKEAVSGTTLADDGPESYVQRLKNRVPSDAQVNVFICQLSTNDATQKRPLGQIGQGPAFNTATVTGAMQEIIAYVGKTWGCPAAFYTGSRYESAEYAAMVVRLKELAVQYGLGVLNLWDNDRFNAITPAQRRLYMSDDIHPTGAGYRDWWCPELERQLLAWLEAKHE